MTNQKSTSRRSSALNQIGISFLLIAFLSGCGKESFETISTVKEEEAPGYFTLAPKLDIVLAQDNTGSMSEIYNQMGAEVPRFLKNLSSTGWDYHFVSMPLTNASSTSGRLFSQIVASKQDRNWGAAEWISPYPGANFSDLESGTVSSTFFRTPSEYTDYRNYLRPSNSLSGVEPGLETIRSQLVSQMSGTGFHRNDAMLLILVVGNGDDTSGRMICRRSDGYEGPCDSGGMSSSTPVRCGTPGLSVSNSCQIGAFTSSSHQPGTAGYARDYYQQALTSLRPSSDQVRVYAAVSNGGNCYGFNSKSGSQYKALAAELNGDKNIDLNICASSASSVLSKIQESLEIQRMSLFTVYLMMDSQPDESTIEVIRYPSGDSSRPVIVPKDAVNGWSFAGRIENEPRIITPSGVALNRASGWAVKLNGSAILSGKDTGRVTYKPKNGN